jgi:predicted RNase H-like HicB family nuclease
MNRPDCIRTSYEWPPIPCGGFWIAWDDRLGADTSPYGQGATEAEAIDDLMVLLEDME